MSRVRTAVCTIVLVCLVAMMPIEARGQRVDPGGAPPAGSGPVDVSGPVRVIDGDTLEAFIHGRRVAIGLIGIRAPGGNTDCGEAATAALQELTRGGLSLVEDASQTFDEAGRRMYLARTRDGRSIAEVLVSEGLARTEGPSPERERLATAEARAATSRTGCVWGGKLPTGDPRPGATSRSATPSRPSAAVAADPTISAAPSATLPAGFVEDVLVTGLSTPTSFAFLPDGRILIAEKNGVVWAFKDGALLPAPFLDMRSEVNNYWDRGLLAIAADPDFASNGHVYLYHSVEHDPANYAGPKVFRLTRVRASGDVAAPGSAVKILGTAAGGPCAVLPAGADCIPADVAWHNGGSIRFDGNGNLYLSTGDSGHHNFVDDRALRAQSLDSLAGKVLRVSRTGVGLPTNPFWNGDPNAVASKVWAYGVRNPFRFVLRPGSGLPYVADVGWVGWDEITTAPAGANLGWPCYEGAAQQSGFQSKSVCQALYGRGASAVAPPLHAYPAANGASVTGGDFYTGTAFPAEYQGSYFFGDYVYGWIRYLRLDDAHRLAAGPTDFATGTAPPIEILMGPDQSLYYITYGVTSGQLRRIRYGSPGTPPQPGVLLHSTLDSATAVSSPDRGTGVGASVTTAPTNDFVPAQTGNGLRIDAVGEQVRFQQVDGTTPNVDLDRGTIDVWYQPAYAHADGVHHPILGIGEWGSGSIHLVKGDATEGDALTVHVFDTAGTHRRTTVPSSAYGWQAGSWVRLRVTWDVHLAGAQDARIYVNGVEPTYAGVVNGPLSMPTESATRYIVLGAAGAPGGGAANGVFDEVTIYDRPIPAAPGPTTNQAPTVTIGSPTASSTYGVGESIAFDASANDPEDGPLPASALEWWLILHHCPGLCHIHQLIDFDGVASGSFAAPDPDYEYPSYLELQVTATDSVGLASTASVTLQPKTVDLSFTSEPTGLRLTFGSESRVTPFRQQVLVGSRSSIGAVSPQQSGDASYDFYSWSDGGAQQHDIVAGVTPTTYTATFVRAGAPPPPAAPAPTSPGASVGGAVPTIDTLRPSFGWSEPAGATGYRVQLSTNAAFTSFVANATTTGPAYSLPSWQTLVRGTQYWWRVQATGASGTGPWSEAFTFRTPTVPGVPVLTAPAHGSTVASPTPTLDWHDVVGATGYQVQVATNSWFGTRVVDTTVTGSSEYTVPSALVPNTTYYWRASARNGAGTSAWTGAWTFAVADGPPTITSRSPADGATAVPVGTNVSVVFSRAMSAATMSGQTLFLQRSDGSPVAAPAPSYDAARRTATLNPTANLEPSTTYVVTARGTIADASGTSLGSDQTWTFTTEAAPAPAPIPVPTSPGAPVGGAVPTIDTLRPPFGWSEPAGATGYRVQLSTNAAFTSFVANATTTGPAYSLPSWQTLVRGTQYWWRVQATGASGTGPWSEAFTFRTPTIPGVPVLAAPAHGSTVASPTPTLDWHDVVGATGYQVQVATNSWFGTRIVDTTVTGDSEYTVPSALVPNTTYYWRVSARNGAGTSAWSGARTFKTPPP